MTEVRESAVDVLIIGAGPTGLFAAAELARHGLRPRIIEQNLEPHRQTRATGVQPSTLEVFTRAGLMEEFLPCCRKLTGGLVVDTHLAPAFSVSFSKLDSVFAFGAVTPQWKTELILEQHLRSFGVEVERGVCARSIETLPSGSVVLLDHIDGTQEKVQAKYTIGASGAHSLLRGVLHEHLDGITYTNSYLVADFSTDFPFDEQNVSYMISPKGLLMLAALLDGRWIAIVDLGCADFSVTPPGIDELRAAAKVHLPGVDFIREMCWASYFHTHRRIAPRFGDGCRFLVGDSAHICSPFGGEGMNAGLQDGVDLAWKLALVEKGLGRPALLEAYDFERRCVAEQVLASADALHRGYYRLVGLAAEGKKLEPATVDPTHHYVSASLLDVGFPDSPMVGEFRGEGVDSAPEGAPGTRFRDRTLLTGTKHYLLLFTGQQNTQPEGKKLSAKWQRQMEIMDGAALGPQVGARAGLPAGGALLVRPDGFVGYRANPWNESAQAALDAHLEKQWVPA